jgi:phosphopantothenate--cysteine ligase
MRILITSGGTKVPLDPVRSITNASTGKFGSAIAKAALLAQQNVIYLTSEQGQSPFTESIDFYRTPKYENAVTTLKNLADFHHQYQNNYIEYRYTNFAEYSTLLKKIIDEKAPDIVILAAAVSDYLIADYSHEKIRSSHALNIQLLSAPKLIHQIKQWQPSTYLVGFKLLIDAPDAELVAAGLKSIATNNADLIVANNLSSLQNNAHEIVLVERDGTYQKVSNNLAETLIARILREFK